MNQPAAVCSLTTLHNYYIFKFGGLLDNEKLNNFIERYDTQNNTWININA